MNVADALAELKEELSTLMQDRWGGALASLAARTSDVLTKYKAHIRNTGGAWHGAADTAHDFIATAPITREQCYVVLNRIRAHLAAHMTTAGAVHLLADTANVITAPEATSNATGAALANQLADILDAHREEAGVHALADTANAITSDDAHAGTLETPVQIGDRHLARHITTHVVLAINGSDSAGPRDMCTNPVIISEDRCLVEAHCWVDQAEDEPDYDARDVDRIRDAWDLHQDLKRALYSLQHGALGGRTEPFTSLQMVRDIELMRYGEEFVDLFVIPAPVPKGPTYQLALGTAESATGGNVGLVVNPSS